VAAEEGSRKNGKRKEREGMCLFFSSPKNFPEKMKC